MLTAGCVHCSAPVVEADGEWSCPDHGATGRLWRTPEATYDAFTEHLRTAGGFPTYVPWPMGAGWSVSDFAVVAATPGRGSAVLTCTSGTSELDGPVDVLVVTEEAGTGLGARCAGTPHVDPGHEIADRAPAARVRIGSQPVSLWAVSTSGLGGELDRSVLAGEAAGRWLWIVLRPASALLLLRDDWLLRDLSDAGPVLVDLPFGGHRPGW